MKKIYILLLLLAFPSVSSAAISLPWSTTYNCSPWTTYSDPLHCDGADKHGAWTTSSGHAAEIVADANYPGGAGGLGFRHWIGDGTNNNSGGLRYTFNSPPSKVWIRWYQRWEAGFNGSWNTFKNIWFEPTSGGRIVHRPTPGRVDFLSQPTSPNYGSHEGWGVDYYTSGVSDGSWICFEVLVDLDTSNYKHWINGTLIHDWTVDYGGASAISYIDIPVNTKNVSNGRDMYVDFDDFAISTTGYIGPLGATPPPPTTFSRGDVNHDGAINTADALLTLRRSLNMNMTGTGWYQSPTTGDVNCDGQADTSDALLILRESLNMDMAGTPWCG